MHSVTVPTAHFTRAVTALGEKRPVVTRSAIFNVQGLKVIDKGVAIDATLYDKLTRHQLRSPLEDSVDSQPAVSGPLLREAAQLMCREDRFAAAMLASLRQPDALLEEVGQVPLPRPIAFQLTVLRETQPALWQRSLRTMVTAAWLGALTGAARHGLRMLAAAGLLHDLGMLHLDPALLKPQLPLGREQRRHLYTHPLLSSMLLERHHEYPQEVVQAVLEHHEALDGSCYPRGLGSTVSPWCRLLGLGEQVSALLEAGGEAPALRLSVALRMNAPRFDPEAMRRVLNWLQPLRESLPGPPAGADPAEALRTIDRLMREWSGALAAAPTAHPARAEAVRGVADLCEKVRQALARSGAAPEQLEMLGPDASSSEVAGELALIARESTWQLRTTARFARRRWRLGDNESFPPSLQAWFDEADAMCARALAT
ncbi:MAG: HD domain-containing phosphohydrolase [Rubrivivax sp.]